MIRLIASLTIVTIVCGAALGLIYGITKEPIRKAELQEKGLKIDAVLSDLNPENNPVENIIPVINEQGDTVEGYLAINGNDTVGIAIASSGLGFAGPVSILTGINITNGQVTGIEVLRQEETPGLGARIQEQWFLDQFKGKSLNNSELVNNNLAVVKDGGDIDAISGATITPRAVCEAVSKSLHLFENLDFGGGR
ncbi:MAG: RnfABCDGE type electron transport complex subunit G [bacterium]